MKYYTKLRKYMDFVNLDYDELIDKGKVTASSSLKKFNCAIPLDQILIENSNYNRGHLKKRLIDSGLLINECHICKIPPLWNNNILVLTIDHINGINNDNRLENLRLLCPNCHSQTDTFCSKKQKKIYLCPECGKEKSKKAKFCMSCGNKYKNKTIKINRRKVKNRPSKIEIENLMKNNSMVAIGKMFDVSDNCIRKWLKSETIQEKKFEESYEKSD